MRSRSCEQCTRCNCHKRSAVELVLHETLGGGFSPPAVAKMHRLSRLASAGADRTRYTSRRPMPYKVHHTQRLSLTIVKEDSRAIVKSSRKLAASLCAAPPVPPRA